MRPPLPRPSRVHAYLAGLTLSSFGTSALMLASGVWVKALTGSDGLAGLLGFAQYAPVLAEPVLGLVADRVRRRRLVVLVSLVMVPVLAPLLLVDDRAGVPVLFVVMTLYGVSQPLSGPAQTALLTRLVPADRLGPVNALRTTLQEGNKLLAPLVGATLFTVSGPHAVVVLDAATFLLAALVLARLPIPDPRPEPSGHRLRAELTAGARHLYRQPDVRVLLLGCGVALAAFGLRSPAVYGMVGEGLGRPPAFLGVLGALQGAGSIAGGIAGTLLIRRLGEHRLAVAGLLAGAAGGALCALPALVPVAAGTVLIGAGMPWLLMAAFTLVQRRTPDELQGRVAGVATLVTFGGMVLAMPLGSLAVTVADYRVTLVVYAAVCLLCVPPVARAHRAAVRRAAGTVSRAPDPPAPSPPGPPRRRSGPRGPAA